VRGEYSTVQYSTLVYCIVQHSTVIQYSVVQQRCTAHIRSCHYPSLAITLMPLIPSNSSLPTSPYCLPIPHIAPTPLTPIHFPSSHFIPLPSLSLTPTLSLLSRSLHPSPSLHLSPPTHTHNSQRLAPLSKTTLTLSVSTDQHDKMDLSEHGSTKSRDNGNIGGHGRKGSQLSIIKIGGSVGDCHSPGYITAPTTAPSVYTTTSNSVTAAAILSANDDHMVGRGKERLSKGQIGGQGRGEKGGVYRRNSHNRGSSVSHTASNTAAATPTSPVDFDSTTSSDGE
jgi:hypothetical protein